MGNLQKITQRAKIKLNQREKLVKKRGWEKTQGKPLIKINKLT